MQHVQASRTHMHYTPPSALLNCSLLLFSVITLPRHLSPRSLKGKSNHDSTAPTASSTFSSQRPASQLLPGCRSCLPTSSDKGTPLGKPFTSPTQDLVHAVGTTRPWNRQKSMLSRRESSHHNTLSLVQPTTTTMHLNNCDDK